MNEHHFGNRIRQELNLGLKLTPDTRERLRVGREIALSRQRQSESVPVMALAGGHGLSSSFSGAFSDWVLPRFVAPALLVVMGAFAITAWQQTQTAHEIEEIDAAVLTGDLPIDAYLDTGFDAWLKRSSQ